MEGPGNSLDDTRLRQEENEHRLLATFNNSNGTREKNQKIRYSSLPDDCVRTNSLDSNSFTEVTMTRTLALTNSLVRRRTISSYQQSGQVSKQSTISCPYHSQSSESILTYLTILMHYGPLIVRITYE